MAAAHYYSVTYSLHVLTSILVIKYSPFATIVMFAFPVSPLLLVASQIYTTLFGVALTVIWLPSFDWSDQCHVTSFTCWSVRHVRLTSSSTHSVSFTEDSIVTFKSPRSLVSLALEVSTDLLRLS